jgi:putative hemolysin
MTVAHANARQAALLKAPSVPMPTLADSAGPVQAAALHSGATLAAALQGRGEPVGPGDAVIARSGELCVSVATTPEEVERALRLRHAVFVGELGARTGACDGIDRDIFDPYCRHLVVTDRARGQVVGTYRVMLPEQARLIGCLYADREFWLTRLNPLRDSIVELGRACVHPDYRTGPTIMLLWSGIGALLASCGHRHLLGCVSVPLADGGAHASDLYHALSRRHLADETLRVWPRQRLDLAGPPADPAAVTIPPLMRGYLRAGAKLLGEPSRDDEFGCADFPMMLRLDELTGRYQRRFM